MNFGLSDSEYELLNRLVIKPLSFRNIKVYVFGSRARGIHHPFSDIDLLLIPTPSTPSPIQISDIKESIEESRFPIKVDFVLLEDLAESYKENVLKEMQKISPR